MPVVRLGIPRLRPEFNDVWGGHLSNGFPEVNVHFPVAAVISAGIKFELEGSSVPDVAVALGNSDGVLGPASHDPAALVLVAIPPHEAVLLEAVANEDDLLIEMSAFESEIVGSCPVSAVLSPPVTVNSESLGKRQDEGVGNTLGETGEEVQAGMSLPGEGPVEVGESVLAPAFAALAPVVLAVSGAVTVTIGINGFVAEVTEQVPGEGHFLFGWAPVPVGVDDSLFLVVPVSWVVFRLQIFQLPEVAIDGDARFPELHVLVDVGGVSSTTLDFEGNQSMDIDLSVTPLCGNPVGWVLADDFSLQDGAFGLEVLADAGDVSCPSALSTRDGMRRPDVGSILAVPMTSHVVRVLLTRVHFVTTLHESEAIVSHASPNPRAVVERRSLAGGAVDIGDAIDAGGRAGSADKVTVEGAAHIPRVGQSRHGVG